MQDALLSSAKSELVRIVKETEKLDIVSIIGMPLTVCGKLYNCAVIVNKGKAIGAVAKQNIPNYSEFYEMRYFTAADNSLCADVPLDEEYSVRLEDSIFMCRELPELTFGVEICEDMWVSSPPSEPCKSTFGLSFLHLCIRQFGYRRIHAGYDIRRT